jgi:hypothetical protein
MDNLTIALITLAVTIGGWLYIWKVEMPREQRRQRRRLEEMRYGFLNRD